MCHPFPYIFKNNYMNFLRYALLFCSILIVASCSKEETIILEDQSNALSQMDVFLSSLQENNSSNFELDAEYEALEAAEFNILDELTSTKSLVVTSPILNVPGDYATIQAAVDASASGDIILVAAGTYTETVTLNGQSLLRIVAEDMVTLEGKFVIQSGSQILIKGFNIKPTGTTGIETQSSNQLEVLRFIDNQIDFTSGNGSMGISTPGMGIGNSMIKRNTILFDTNAGSKKGFKIEGGNNNRIVNNTVNFPNIESQRIGIEITNSNSLIKRNTIKDGTIGILLFQGNNNTFNKNKCIDNEEYGILLDDTDNNQVSNNTALDNGICDITTQDGVGNSQSNNNTDCVSGF